MLWNIADRPVVWVISGLRRCVGAASVTSFVSVLAAMHAWPCGAGGRAAERGLDWCPPTAALAALTSVVTAHARVEVK
jgi:hypothetical protein